MEKERTLDGLIRTFSSVKVIIFWSLFLSPVFAFLFKHSWGICDLISTSSLTTFWAGTVYGDISGPIFFFSFGSWLFSFFFSPRHDFHAWSFFLQLDFQFHNHTVWARTTNSQTGKRDKANSYQRILRGILRWTWGINRTILREQITVVTECFSSTSICEIVWARRAFFCLHRCPSLICSFQRSSCWTLSERFLPFAQETAHGVKILLSWRGGDFFSGKKD